MSSELKRVHQEKIKSVFQEVGKVVVGQDYMINRLLIGLFTQGHVLLEGVPGLAKTLTVNTLARVLHLDFQRIQFTPDLLPADLIGTMIYNQQKSEFEVKKGPIFANIILADEVNRSPAKVQSALLESMQEKQVTIGESTFSSGPTIFSISYSKPGRTRRYLSTSGSSGRSIYDESECGLSYQRARAGDYVTYVESEF